MATSNVTHNGNRRANRGIETMNGPLGIESASLVGKVALVTGSGKCC
jgi:hypothetical protein